VCKASKVITRTVEPLMMTIMMNYSETQISSVHFGLSIPDGIQRRLNIKYNRGARFLTSLSIGGMEYSQRPCKKRLYKFNGESFLSYLNPSRFFHLFITFTSSSSFLLSPIFLSHGFHNSVNFPLLTLPCYRIFIIKLIAIKLVDLGGVMVSMLTTSTLLCTEANVGCTGIT
jgi:hypothetical protein